MGLAVDVPEDEVEEEIGKTKLRLLHQWIGLQRKSSQSIRTQMAILGQKGEGVRAGVVEEGVVASETGKSRRLR